MAGAGVDAGRELREARAFDRVDEALDVGPDRIALAREDVDRQVLSDAGEAVGGEEAGQRVENVDGELVRKGEAAERVGDIGVDFGRVAREPVEFGSRRLERLVEVAEPHLEDEPALAAPAEPQPLRPSDEPAQGRDRRRRAVRARIDGAGQSVRVVGDERPAEERARGMAEKDDGRARLLGGDEAVEGP